MTSTRTIAETRFIAASPSTIFNLLADPRQHPRLDGSGTVGSVRRGPPRLFLGATFSMNMKIKVNYFTRNKVVVFEENRSIAWHHIAQFVWRYDLEEHDNGTIVTESFNYDKPWGFAAVWGGFPEKNRAAITDTLRRLEEIVTA